MEIRQARKEDIIGCIPLIKAFSESIEMDGNWDIRSTTHAMSLMIDTGVFLIAEIDDEIIGCAGGTFGYSLWNKAVKLFEEQVYYVSSRHRQGKVGKLLLTSLIREAIRDGGKMISLKKMYNSPPVDKIYKRLGFKELETTYIMEV